MHANGTQGWSQFPVNERVTYIIRDNKVACDGMNKSPCHYDIFMVTGDKPTLHRYHQSQFICATDDYVEACAIIERVIDKVESLIRHTQFAEWTSRRAISR